MNHNDPFDVVRVRFVGTRQSNMRVFVYVFGKCYSGDGYIFGPGVEKNMYRCEAETLTGAIAPDVRGDGTVKTGFVVDGDLGDIGLTGEAYEIVQPEAEQPEPKPKRKRASESELVEDAPEAVTIENEV